MSASPPEMMPAFHAQSVSLHAVPASARAAALHLGALLQSSPTTIFSPNGTSAHWISSLALLVTGICTAIFLVVAGLLLYAIIRFRRRPTDSAHEPPQIYGSNQIEVSWTVIPILIVVVLFLATARVVLLTEKSPRPQSAVDVTVVGHQFWWEFRYPHYGIITANELHVPVSDPRHPTPTYLTMSSADTDHSFWVPRLAGKMDVIPNKVNVMWLDPDKAGLYLGQCANFCGTEHAKMLIRVYADTPENFAAWIAKERKNAAEQPKVAEGRNVFLSNACMNCHTIAGTPAEGKFGPNLTHLASRDTFASGSVPLTEANLHAFINDPSQFKPGVLMPAMHLNDRDLDAVTRYLMTLR